MFGDGVVTGFELSPDFPSRCQLSTGAYGSLDWGEQTQVPLELQIEHVQFHM